MSPIDPATLEVGFTVTHARTFSASDVGAFAAVTGDHGQHHVEPNAAGQLMVHGLLTASLPTKIGGDLNYIAATMTFEFLRPVYTGDTITVVGTVARIEPTPE